MGYLSSKTGNTFNLVYIKVLGGYDIYIPGSYNNQEYFLKCGCPVWIKKREKEYDVWEIENTRTWEEDIINYISTNLPKIEGPYFRNVHAIDNTVADMDKDSLIEDLSVRQYDYKGNIVLEIQAFNRQAPTELIESGMPIPTIEVVFKKNGKSFQNKRFIDYILNREDAKPYRNRVMWCDAFKYSDCINSFGFERQTNEIATRII